MKSAVSRRARRWLYGQSACASQLWPAPGSFPLLLPCPPFPPIHPLPSGPSPLAPLPTRPAQLFNLLGPPEFLPSRKSTADLFGEICQSSPAVCVSVITAIAGFNGQNVNLTRLPDYVHYAPSGG